MEPEAGRAMAQSFKTAFDDWHMPKVLTHGATFTANTLTPEQAQMLLSRKFSINDIARWLGLPPHMLGDLDRATFSNVEQQALDFVTYSLGPWLSLWEFAINSQLILANRYYAEFKRDALVRGDLLSRWQAYQIQIQTGARPRNEIRRSENLKKLPGLDTPLEPAFISGRRAIDGPPAPARQSGDNSNARASAIVRESASRLLRKEVAQVRKFAVRHAADGDAFAAAVADFYAEHVSLVMQALQLSREAASSYCSRQAAQVITGEWVAAVTLWDTDNYAAGLAALAIEEEAA
jgi:hypothetical protein